jgi:hypothetical protein
MVICVEANEPANAGVLNHDRVHAGGNHRPQILFGLGHLVLEHERVEGDVAAHAAPVQELHQLWQIGFGKVVRAHPGVEPLETEINGVRAVLDRGFGTLPVAGG